VPDLDTITIHLAAGITRVRKLFPRYEKIIVRDFDGGGIRL
jgi:hypothetical protein